MNVSIVGSGNVASVLARLAFKKGHSIVQIIARNEAKGNDLANEVNAQYINFSGRINNVDLVIIALSDSALPEAIEGLNFGDAVLVHTAGAMSMHLLENSHSYAVLYPLQSLKKEKEQIPEIPFLLEANNEETYNFVASFALTLSDTVIYMEEDKRMHLQTAATIVNNFTNYIYTVTNDFCVAENLDFNLLKPLIKETADRVQNYSPREMQTGPAKRNDFVTLEKHLRILSKYPKIKTLYTRMTDGIMNG